MTLEQLKQAQQNLLIERANLKTRLEQVDTSLGQITFALTVLNQQPADKPNLVTED